MPFQKLDDESFDDESVASPYSGRFEYESAQVRLNLGELHKRTRDIIQALQFLKITGIQVNYDGGHDEGFAHPDHFLSKGSAKNLDEVIPQFSQMSLVEEERQELSKNPRSSWMSKKDLPEIATGLIEDLTDDLASMLLGRGYGTGDYTLYGSFIADFEKLTIIDNPNAQPPSGGLGG